MMTNEKFIGLLEKYTLNTITPGERSELFSAISTGLYDELLSQHIDSKLQSDETQGANLPPHIASDILRKILSSEKENELLLPKRSRQSKIIRRIAVAASLVTIIAAIYFLSSTVSKKTDATNPATAFARDLEEKTNASTQPLKIRMEDGSVITLQPGSVIHYPQHFLPDKREVSLEGEAFFEVSKAPNRPFFVSCKNIMTHVLGTSFNVKTNKEARQVEVSVRSGKVEVYERDSLVNKRNIKKSNGVILLPNQKVIYDEEVKQFVPLLVDNPLPLITELKDKKALPESSVFEETSLKTLLPYLEKSYGIEIVTENENLYKCLFTGDITRQELFNRLDIICQAIGASYEVKGTRILIKGKGCN